MALHEQSRRGLSDSLGLSELFGRTSRNRSMTTVAQRYGVSANYLARICERLVVPRPGRG